MYKYLGDTEILMYDIFNFVSIIALLVMNMSLLKKKASFLSYTAQNVINRLTIRHNNSFLCNPLFIAFIEMFFISLVQYGPVGVITKKFGNIVHTGNNYFGVLYLVPFILMFFFYIIKIPPLKQMDMITPAYSVANVFIKIACFCAGCCNGFEWDKGLYNAVDDRYEFPVQLVEASLALFIFIFLLWYRKKAKEGTMFPVYLIVYSGTRFFSEFLRHEEEVFWIFKTYHLLCIAGVVLGVAELLLVQKYKDKINKFYEPKKRARIKF